MSQVIAGIYEIEKQIGSGGGGIVYLGHHLRLDKKVVLKADKRTLNTKSEALRREVDMLKGLSHRYIPQVYDFVQQNGVVYTVMDYIEGESLDKLLLRNQSISQKQVIKWACQLLEALSYLHSRPPHGILHGDMKPANIMLRPDGDICLIDYNIALALGEEGAVKVGYSRGYASPEHYGAEYINNDRNTFRGKFSSVGFHGRGKDADGMEETETGYMADVTETNCAPDITETVWMTGIAETAVSAVSGTGSSRSVMLDVRSDIYSLGATLYHLLSGRRPVQNAGEVEPLGAEACSPAVSDIIKKAMSPVPDMRYQSADEMLAAFLQLHKRDKRARRHKRRILLSAASLSVMFLVGGAAAFVGLKQMEQIKESLVLAEYSSGALDRGDVHEAVKLAMEAVPEENNIFSTGVSPQIRKALTDALNIYDLSDGFKPFGVISLPSAPFGISISPGRTHFAVRYDGAMQVFDWKNMQEPVTLPMQKSALADAVFINETQIIYAGDKGVTLYDLKAQETLWTGEEATGLAVSGDGQIAAAVNRDTGHAVIYHISDGEKLTEYSFDGRHMAVAANDIFANPGDNVFALNADGSLLAVSFSDGALIIGNLDNPGDDMIIYEESDYRHFTGGFSGKYFTFTAEKNDQSLLGLIDTVSATYVGGYESRNRFLLRAEERGIYLSHGNLLVNFNPDTLKETEIAYTDSVNITGFSVGKEHVLVTADDNTFSFYDSGTHRMSSESSEKAYDFIETGDGYAVLGNRDEPSLRLLKLEEHQEAQLLAYDARYPHDEARISQDGKTVMLFSYQDFRIYDMNGNVVTEKQMPDSGQIYDQQFRKEGGDSWLEVIWYDGTVRCYSARDGSLISEETGESPEKDLYEEFYTELYKITSPLHGTPEVYDLKTGRSVGKLESEDYLTYVTQAGEYIITEYVSAAGERYGLLLDEELQTLAYLPDFCDMNQDMAVFDCKSGNLRQRRLYSLQELLVLGERYIEENGGEM